MKFKVSSRTRPRSAGPRTIVPRDRAQSVQIVRAYAAAQSSRLTNDWQVGRMSADSEICHALPILRDRCRDLERNNDYARKFLRLCDTNILGASGINYQCKMQARDGKFDRDKNTAVERGWLSWGRAADTTGTMTWRDAEGLILRSVARDGGVLARLVEGYPDNDDRFAVQLIEIDHLDHNYFAFLENGNQVRFGIETNSWGRPVAYHLFAGHPGDMMGVRPGASRRVRIEATEMLHIFVRERIGQTLGIPWMVSGTIRMKMLAAFEETTLVAARVGAAKMGFIKMEAGRKYTGEEDQGGNIVESATPGSFTQLPPGAELIKWDPAFPTTEFGGYVKSHVQGIACGFGVSYTSLSGDLSDVNFSSIRAGVLEEREMWKLMQCWFSIKVEDPVHKKWRDMAVLTGTIGYDPRLDDFQSHQFRGRRWPWVDPTKDLEAAEKAINLKVRSRRDVIAENGGDIEDVFDEIADDEALAIDRGISLQEGGAPPPTLTEQTEEEIPEELDVEELEDEEASQRDVADLDERAKCTNGTPCGKICLPPGKKCKTVASSGKAGGPKYHEIESGTVATTYHKKIIAIKKLKSGKFNVHVDGKSIGHAKSLSEAQNQAESFVENGGKAAKATPPPLPKKTLPAEKAAKPSRPKKAAKPSKKAGEAPATPPPLPAKATPPPLPVSAAASKKAGLLKKLMGLVTKLATGGKRSLESDIMDVLKELEEVDASGADFIPDAEPLVRDDDAGDLVQVFDPEDSTTWLVTQAEWDSLEEEELEQLAKDRYEALVAETTEDEEEAEEIDDERTLERVQRAIEATEILLSRRDQ